MNLSDKMSYLRGMIDGMELDLTTSKEGKVLAQLLEVMQETVLYVTDLQDQVDELTELCESLDEDLGDVEAEVFGDDEYEDEEDEADYLDDEDEEEDLYEVVCPNCQNTIVLADSVLDEGTMHCPCCNELLEFDYSELTMDDLEEAVEEAEEVAEAADEPEA